MPPTIDIWELESHSDSTHPQATNSQGSGTLETTTGQADGGPLVAMIEASTWTQRDVELALDIAMLIVYAALAYAVLTQTNE